MKTAARRLPTIFEEAVQPRQSAFGATSVPAAILPQMKRDAAAAQIELDAFGQKLALRLTGNDDNLACRAAPKADDRIHEKTREKYLGDYASNCDLAAITIHLTDAASARDALDLCAVKPGQYIVLDDRTTARVIEFEDNLTRQTSYKGGLPNATAVVEIMVPRGEDGFVPHTCEIQFVPKQAAADMRASHDAYKQYRTALRERQELFQNLKAGGGRLSLSLSADWRRAQDAVDTYGSARVFYNERAATKASWLGEIKDYVPGSRTLAKLETAMPRDISSPQLKLAA